jgi:peptidyl-prolyl cis-trans isomerase B (cyclophilin B)
MTDATPPKAPKAPAAPKPPAAAKAPAAAAPPPPPAPPVAPAAPQPYAAQQQPYGSVAYQPANYAPTNTLAIIALILGFVLPLGGIICGHIALGQIKRTGENGHGLALAGTIIGYVLTGLGLLLTIIYVIFFVALVGSGVLAPGTVI